MAPKKTKEEEERRINLTLKYDCIQNSPNNYSTWNDKRGRKKK